MKYRLKVNLKVSRLERYTAGAILDDKEHGDLIKRNLKCFEKVVAEKKLKKPEASSSPNSTTTAPATPASAPATNKQVAKPEDKTSEPVQKDVAPNQSATKLVKRNQG